MNKAFYAVLDDCCSTFRDEFIVAWMWAPSLHLVRGAFGMRSLLFSYKGL